MDTKNVKDQSTEDLQRFLAQGLKEVGFLMAMAAAPLGEEQEDFAASVAAELHLWGAAFDRATLEAYVGDAWPLIEDNPDPAAWAREFTEDGYATRTT